MLHDLRLALRQLARSPGYTVVVVLTLAFGIAVNTNIFGVVSTFFLQRMPVPDADRVVLVTQRSESWPTPHAISFPDFQDYRERLRSMESMLAYQPMPAHLGTDDGRAAQRAWIEVATPGAFAALAIAPQLGRVLVPADGEAAGGAPVIVLSHRGWQQRFGGDPAIVGRTIRVNNRPFTVVGVAPERFTGFSPFLAVHGFVPTGALDTLRGNGAGMLEWRNAPMWRVLGKLRPGTTLAAARAEADIATAQLVREHASTHQGVSAAIIPEHRARPDPMVADFLPLLALFFLGQVALVLLIACANVANLMIARAAGRQKEFTVRAALGASRGRLVRQMLVESLVLAAVAGVVGWFLSTWTAPLLSALVQQGDLPVNQDPGPAWPINLFTAAVSLGAGIGSGLLPALRASRVDLVSQLKEGPGAGIGRSRHRLRDLFVVNQVMFSLVVLVFAGLFTRSLQRARSVDIGFRSERLLLASFDLTLQRYGDEPARQFCGALLERVRALPGVEDASLTSSTPFDYSIGMRDVFPENPPPSLRYGSTNVGCAAVAPGFEHMLGLQALAGRPLDATDTATTRPVAVINAAFAERCWPGQDALGRRFQPWRDGPWIEVVGVVATAKYMMLSEAPRPFYYTPLAQGLEGPVSLLVRTTGDPAVLAAPVRSTLAALDPNLPVYNVRTMEEMMANSLFAFLPLRMGALLSSIQGVLGLGLAVLGLYSVVAFGVAQRSREIGIRMALGASAGSVLREVLRDGLRLTLVGTVAGLLFSIVLGIVLSKFLFGMSALDPLVLCAGVAVLLGVAAVACFVPARRATRTDPAVVLRAE